MPQKNFITKQTDLYSTKTLDCKPIVIGRVLVSPPIVLTLVITTSCMLYELKFASFVAFLASFSLSNYILKNILKKNIHQRTNILKKNTPEDTSSFLSGF